MVAALVVAGGIWYFVNNSGQISSKAAGEKLIKYLNEKELPEGMTASLVGVVDEKSVYNIKFTVNEQEVNVFMSKDGKYLFPQSIDMEATPQNNDGTGQTTEIPKNDKPEVQLFVMSFCPYGNLAEDITKPVVDLLGNNMNLTVHYIVSKQDSTYVSLHGDQELNQNVRELCVAKYQKDKFWAFVGKINSDCTAQNADTCWESVAKGLGIDTAKIKSCENSEKSALLDKEIELTTQLGVQGSPQLFVNGVEYTGQRTAEDYKSAICSAFNNQPEACKTVLSSDQAAAQGGCQ